jgi:hypothetical protein
MISSSLSFSLAVGAWLFGAPESCSRPSGHPIPDVRKVMKMQPNRAKKFSAEGEVFI